MTDTALIGMAAVVLVLVGLGLLDTWRARRPGGARPASLLERVAALEARMTAVEVTNAATLRTLERITLQLDDLIDEGKMRRIIREEQGSRRRGGPAMAIHATNVEAVAGRDVRRVADTREGAP